MKISILCSSIDHPVFPWVTAWQQAKENIHAIELVTSTQELTGGDILFLISSHEIVTKKVLKQYAASLVIHASDLPEGRGWSPHIWQIIEGRRNITVSILEAEEKFDTGAIWQKKSFHLEGHELFDEINEQLFKIELDLMDFAIENIGKLAPIPQKKYSQTYYRKRTLNDSRIDPEKSIVEQFGLLRVADPTRFPAFMDYCGFRYRIKLEKVGPLKEND